LIKIEKTSVFFIKNIKDVNTYLKIEKVWVSPY